MKRLLLLSLLALAGCGQLGPLYFDEDPPADQMPPSRKQATATPLPVPQTRAAPACAAVPAASGTATPPAAPECKTP